MSLYYNKKLISGVRDVPSMTLAEYNALTNKPKLWIRTDAPESDRGINADDIEYDNDTSVKEKIDSVASNMSIVTVGNGQNTVTINLPFDLSVGSGKSGTILIFNGNRPIVGVVKLENNSLSYTDIVGGKNPSLSVNNNVLSIDWGERTWGTTCYMICWR